MQERILPRHFISMEEDTLLVCRKSKISMQEGREVEGQSVIRLILTFYDYLLRAFDFSRAEIFTLTYCDFVYLHLH